MEAHKNRKHAIARAVKQSMVSGFEIDCLVAMLLATAILLIF